MFIADYIKNNLPQWPVWINSILLRMNVFGPLVYGRSYCRRKKIIYDQDVEKMLVDSANFAIKNVAYYREKYGNLVIHDIKEFQERIGFIDKDEVMSHWDKFIADGVDLKNCAIGTTGGTSGKALKLANTNGRYSTELAFMHSMWERAGWHYSLRGVIRNHKLAVNKNYIVNPITKELIFDAFRISPEYVRLIVKVMKKYHCMFMHAYPSAAYQFCKICHNEHLDISFIKCFLCGSEAVTNEQRHFIVEKMGINIYSWYGHSEKLILGGYKDEESKIHIEPNYGFFELIDGQGNAISEANVQGEMVGTTFYNRVMPLLRYRTGDYGTLEARRKSYSDYAVMKEIVGRRDENLIYRNDGTTTSITALNLHDDLYDRLDGLQYVQENKGELTVLVIPGNGYSDSVKEQLYRHCKNAMGEDSVVEIKEVEKLIYSKNGKFLPLVRNREIKK